MLDLVFLSFPVGAWIVAALNDAEEMKIPNWISIFLLVSFPVAALWFGYTPAMIGEAALVGAGVLVIGFVLFALNVFGGGDAKLLAASAPWVGLAGLLPFFIKVTLVGGALGLFLLMFRRSPILPVYARVPWLMGLHEGGKQVPYGIAIALGGLWALPDLPLYQRVLGL